MTDLIAADFGIRQLHARFADAVWRQDAEVFAGCFAEGGEWKIAGMHFTGLAAIRDACGQLLGRCTRIHLLTGQALLAPAAEGVSGRLSMTEFAWMPDGTQFITMGVYHDHYVESSGQWLFASRFWSLKYRGQTDLSAPLVDTPDYGVFPGRPAEGEPTFVRKA